MPARSILTAGDATATHDPSAFEKAFSRRPDAALPFDLTKMPEDAAVMPDTNFYILRSQRKIPAEILRFVMGRTIRHCGVALAELSIAAGLLAPSHAATPKTGAALSQLLNAIPLADCRAPSPQAWAEAGIVSGILARTQFGLAVPKAQLSAAEKRCQDGRRRRLLNDVLLFLTAAEQNAITLSSNVSDMDFLLQFRPDAHVLLYRQT